MPFVTLMTKPEFFPDASYDDNTGKQQLIKEFGVALPKLMAKHQRKLHFGKSDVKPSVIFRHMQPYPGTNIPDIYLHINFGFTISKRRAHKALRKLSWIIEDWFSDNAQGEDDSDQYYMPSFLVEGKWGDILETIAMERVTIEIDY